MAVRLLIKDGQYIYLHGFKHCEHLLLNINHLNTHNTSIIRHVGYNMTQTDRLTDIASCHMSSYNCIYKHGENEMNGDSGVLRAHVG